jgi:anaphase-promoting complex subunit 2
MLKDIQDSKKVNAAIRKAQHLEPDNHEIKAANALLQKEFPEGTVVHVSPEGMGKPSVHAKILSRLFWPQLHEESFLVPPSIGQIQNRYHDGFQALKTGRKLTWLDALGQATVELELKDRTILEEVHTWQATVIYAFRSNQEEDDDEEDDSDVKEDTSPRRSVLELVESLEMDEVLVRSALKFWVNNIVLQEVEKDVFEVLETLNQEDRARSNAQSAVTAAAAPDSSEDASLMSSNENISKENQDIYWRFVHGMLKNSSSQVPLQQIGMMLRMLVPDGFPHSNEELQELLERRVAEGELEFVGGKYRLKK